MTKTSNGCFSIFTYTVPWFQSPHKAHAGCAFSRSREINMPKIRHSHGNHPQKPPRSKWGTVLARYDRTGMLIAWQVRYPNPLEPGKRVQRQFKPDQELEARRWLEAEKYLVSLHRNGIAEWVHPTERSRRKAVEEKSRTQRNMLFRNYVMQWAEEYRLPDGNGIAGGTRRNLYLDIGHFLPSLGDLPLNDITPSIIKAWYDAPHPEGRWAFRRSCMRLKAVLESATRGGLDGSEPLLSFNPFIFHIPSAPQPARINVPPVTPHELILLADAMPDYTRLSVFLSTLVGGLRCGELCGLQVQDIDLNRQILHVRRSVNRGDTDRGELHFGKTKTESSIRNVHIPDTLIPLIRQHLSDYCDLTRPDSSVFVPKRAKIMSQTTLDGQFAKARLKAGRPDLMFQALRASHATLLMIQGGTLREVMNQLGHVSEKVAIRYYQLTVASHQSQVVDKLAESFMSGIQRRES